MRNWILVILLAGAAASSSSCATRGLSAKQTITVDVLQPSHDTLANLQDFVESSFKAGTLSSEARVKVETILAPAFRDHAKATRAVRAWRAGDPTPQSVLDLSKDVHDVLEVVKVTVPATSRVLTLAQELVDDVAKVVSTVRP